jgi:hypothetical protein
VIFIFAEKTTTPHHQKEYNCPISTGLAWGVPGSALKALRSGMEATIMLVINRNALMRNCLEEGVDT